MDTQNAPAWAVYVKHGEELSALYWETLWELEAVHVPDPRTGDGTPGEDVDVWKVSLDLSATLEHERADHARIMASTTERKLQRDPAVILWQDYVE